MVLDGDNIVDKIEDTDELPWTYDDTESEDDDSGGDLRSLPPGLIGVETRNSRHGTLEAYNRMVNERYGDPGIKSKSKSKLKSKLNKGETGMHYYVLLSDITEKLDGLIEMFTFMKVSSKYSEIVSQIRGIIKTGVSHLHNKYDTYNRMIAVREQIQQWAVKAEAVSSSLTEFNIATGLNPNVNINSLNDAFMTGIKGIIGKLPIQRVSKELELSQGILSMCSKLLGPFTQSADIQCPVCLQGGDEIYAIKHCGHVICKECVNRLHDCPICRTSFNHNDTLRLYINTTSDASASDTVEPHDPNATTFAGIN
jgi:hypothetical protein